MEKISFFDFLSIVLPGAILTIFIVMFSLDEGLVIDSLVMNEFFGVTIFLSISIFLGSLINIQTWQILRFHKWIGIHKSIYHLYNKATSLDKVREYFDKEMSEYQNEENDFEKMERLWSEVYYKLEAHDQIRSPKIYKSYYFFFRNFFTLGLILILLHLSFYGLSGCQVHYLNLLFLDLFIIITSYLGARWNRSQMVKHMFWTYYSIYKSN